MSRYKRWTSTITLLSILCLIGACTPKYREHDWSKRYLFFRDAPYDVMVLFKLFEEREAGLEVLTNNFQRKIRQAEESTYIQIGASINLDSNKISTLKEYVYKGNNAYLISDNTPYYLLNEMYRYYPVIGYGDTAFTNIEVHFEGSDKQYFFEHQYKGQPAPFNWSRLYYDSLYSDTASQPEPLSYFADTCVNFYKVKFGKGTFYFHTQPLLFTNFMLKAPSGFEHLQEVFKDLKPGEVYWDISYNYRQIEDRQNASKTTSPLKLLFSHRSLKWGWYVFLIGVVLFVLFRSKRRQRLIPVLAGNRNDSLEFAKNMGKLYFTSNNHKFIALEMYDTFLIDARNRYQIDTNLKPKEIFAQLAKKSGLGQELMDQLLDHFKIRFSEYSKSDQLIRLHNTLNHYYNFRK